MAYRVTKRSAETLAKMRQARAARRIESPAPTIGRPSAFATSRAPTADVSMLLEAFCGHACIDLHAERRQKLGVLWKRAWEADAGGALYRPGHAPRS